VSELDKSVAIRPSFLRIFPRATKQQDKMFKLLKRAYIDTREQIKPVVPFNSHFLSLAQRRK